MGRSAGHATNSAKAFLFYLFLLVLVLAPVPLGSNREWSWTLCAALISSLALAWCALSLPAPERQSIRLNPVLIVSFLLVCVWAIVQAGGFVPEHWKHPLWAMSSPLLAAGDATQFPGSISLAPDDSFTAVMRLLSYGLVFFLAFQWGRDRHRAKTTLQWLVLAGLAYAIYGLAVFWSGSGGMFLFEDPGFRQDVRGTFMNRNHFATYAGLILLCAISLFYQRIALHGGPASPMPAKGRVPPGAHITGRSERLERFVLQVWKPLIIILLLSTALILTHSRGGFFSTMVAGMVLLACFNYRRRIRSTGSLAVVGLAVGIAFIAFWLTSEVLLKRIDQTQFDDNLRFAAYQIITESTGDSPILGFGYGTFADSFRLYRTDIIDAYLDRAHNTYLENAFELGWPAALLLFTAIALACSICIRGLRRRGRDWVYPATGIAATVLVAVHSYFDFGLQIPAVAMTYAGILGISCAQSYPTSQ